MWFLKLNNHCIVLTVNLPTQINLTATQTIFILSALMRDIRPLAKSGRRSSWRLGQHTIGVNLSKKHISGSGAVDPSALALLHWWKYVQTPFAPLLVLLQVSPTLRGSCSGLKWIKSFTTRAAMILILNCKDVGEKAVYELASIFNTRRKLTLTLWKPVQNQQEN